MKNLILVLFLFLTQVIYAQKIGYEISIDIQDYEQEELYLGYHYGNKQLIQDTARRNDQGRYVFADTASLTAGVYLIILAPDNDYFQLLIADNEQHLQIQTKKEDLTGQLSIKGSPDNKRFKKYLTFLQNAGPRADKLRKEIAKATNESEKSTLQDQLQQINSEVKALQQSIIKEAPNSLTALLIRANIPSETPQFEGSPEEIQQQQLYYYRSHYFDVIDLADPRMIRTPFFFNKVNDYVKKLHYQVPDSLIQAMDFILEKMQPAKENFRYFLAHYLTEYANSKIVGMDAVYVHLALNYYGKGLADWLTKEQLDKILDDAKDLEPLLIGKKAPDIKMQKENGTMVNLYSIESTYTIVYFWAYDCGHCKKSTPYMRDFYTQFKDRGVTLFAVCSSSKGKDVAPCWDYIQENTIDQWLHTIDPIGWSKIYYKVKSTPQMYILDQDKKIIMKNIDSKQLEEVMEKIMEHKEKE